MAFVFHCTAETEGECLSRNLLGMPDTAHNRRATAALGEETEIYLFNRTSRELLGPFRARGGVGESLEADAWGGRFSWQLRVSPVEDAFERVRVAVPLRSGFHQRNPAALRAATAPPPPPPRAASASDSSFEVVEAASSESSFDVVEHPLEGNVEAFLSSHSIHVDAGHYPDLVTPRPTPTGDAAFVGMISAFDDMVLGGDLTRITRAGSQSSFLASTRLRGSTRAGGRSSSEWPKTLKFFHGTSWEAAQLVFAEGFKPSGEGCFGPGVYVGRADKATKFAMNKKRHGADVGGLIECECTISNPKFVVKNARYDDIDWRAEGHDAVRADLTTASDHMEWCIASPQEVRVTRIFRVPEHGTLGDLPPDAPPLVPPEAAEKEPRSLPLSIENVRAHARRVRSDEAQRRFFNCPTHGPFWKKVIHKRNGVAVARCKRCPPGQPKLVALPLEEERGRGLFECTECGNVWTSNTACRTLAQYCFAEGCSARDRGIFPKAMRAPDPGWLRARRYAKHAARLRDPDDAARLRDIDENTAEGGEDSGVRVDAAKFSNFGGGGGGDDCSATVGRDTASDREFCSVAGDRPVPTLRPGVRRKHSCSGCATGVCKQPPPPSPAHESTGSTAGTLSDATWSTANSQWSEGSIHTQRSPAHESTSRRRKFIHGAVASGSA